MPRPSRRQRQDLSRVSHIRVLYDRFCLSSGFLSFFASRTTEYRLDSVLSHEDGIQIYKKLLTRTLQHLLSYLCVMKLQPATSADFESVLSFYDDVIERTPGIEIYAQWFKGKHPTAEGLRACIDEGSMYLYRENGAIVGAMSLTMYQGEEYHAIKWIQEVSDDDVAVISIFAVSPDRQCVGIGSVMVREAIKLAYENGKKAVRLDALASNTPGHRFYERLGFEYRGRQYLYAENCGWKDFYFFEFKNE